jgi:hypothetical protein
MAGQKSLRLSELGRENYSDERERDGVQEAPGRVKIFDLNGNRLRTCFCEIIFWVVRDDAVFFVEGELLQIGRPRH